MLNLYKHTLMKKNYDSLIQFELLEELLTHISVNNGFHISDNYLLKIIKCYLNNEIYTPFICSKTDSIYFLCEKIIEIYKANLFSKFNFILKDFKIAPDIQKWLLMSKENIFKLCAYHLLNNDIRKKQIIFFNQFFKIIHIEKNIQEVLSLPHCNTSGISIQILLSGKVFYNFQESSILLNQGEALITSSNSFLQNFTVYSPSVEMLIIHLNYNFMKNLYINPNEIFIKKYYFSNSIEDFKKVLNPDFFLKNPLFFYEILISLLKQGNVSPDKFTLISNSSNNVSNIIFCIKGNIKLSSNEIIGILENYFSLPKNKLDSLIYSNFKLTLHKLIIKLKIDSIMNDFFQPSSSIEALIREYNIKNINSFKYFLNVFYKINLKSLEQIKRSI